MPSRRGGNAGGWDVTSPKGDPNVVPTWWSPPGMVKKFCPGCEHWFSGLPNGPGRCPECVSKDGTGAGGRARGGGGTAATGSSGYQKRTGISE